MKQILKDIPRTIKTPGNGRKALFAVLKCLAIHFPEVGYVQGMSYLAATLMKYTTPENSFFIMISLFDDYGVKEQFLPGMMGANKNFYVLLSLQKKYLPAIYRKFSEEGFLP